MPGGRAHRREGAVKVQFSEHALEAPERKERHDDGTVHYLARVSERGGRVLRVVVNPGTRPPSVVTAFLDRRMKGELP